MEDEDSSDSQRIAIVEISTKEWGCIPVLSNATTLAKLGETGESEEGEGEMASEDLEYLSRDNSSNGYEQVSDRPQSVGVS